jgi:hypothetical protein
MVRRVFRMIKEAPESRVKLFASLLEEMAPAVHEDRPRRGRRRS